MKSPVIRTGLLIFLVINLSFGLGYIMGKPKKDRVIQRPSLEKYHELEDRVDSLQDLRPHKTDTVYHDDNEIVVLQPEYYVDVLRKFSPKKSFENYPVSGRFTGTIPPLNFSTCEWHKEYITMTKIGVKDGVQFAGYYAFASWGCGCPCQMCSIIDLRNGNVYAGPYASGGYEYRIDSRILVVNPPDSNGYYYANGPMPHPEQYLWTGSSFERLE